VAGFDGGPHEKQNIRVLELTEKKINLRDQRRDGRGEGPKAERRELFRCRNSPKKNVNFTFLPQA
jgi:hypothetical protein